jgi:hypothetical protein
MGICYVKLLMISNDQSTEVTNACIDLQKLGTAKMERFKLTGNLGESTDLQLKI